MDLFRKTWTPAEAGVCLASVRMKKKAENKLQKSKLSKTVVA